VQLFQPFRVVYTGSTLANYLIVAGILVWVTVPSGH
jgi:hypothetical protein